MICQYIIHEYTYPTHSEVRFTNPQQTETERIIYYHTDPEHQCDREAVRKSVSMNEQPDSSWLPVETVYYCDQHFVKGLLTHLDGSISYHLEQAIDD